MQKSDFPSNWTGFNGRANYLHREMLYLIEQAEMHPQTAAQLLALWTSDAAVVSTHLQNAAQRTVMSGPGTGPWVPALVSIAVAPTTASLAVGATRQLTVTKTPSNAPGTPAFASSNTAVATVNASGLVTAVGAGNCVINATLSGKGSPCAVTVTA